jgi:hypothetical protein
MYFNRRMWDRRRRKRKRRKMEKENRKAGE